jgi:hypothetical protein
MARAYEPVSDYVRRQNPEPILKHLHPEDSIILSVLYDPGWSPDLTSWTIQISDDGIVSQAVQWSRMRGRGGEEELLDSVFLELPKLAEIQRLIDCGSTDGFQSLQQADCIDDAARVSLNLPLKRVRLDLPYFHLEYELRKGYRQFDATQRASFSSFGQIWNFADRHAPYSLSEHQNNRTKRSS